MPDWSYRPLFQPWFLRWPRRAHVLVLAVLRVLGRSPLLHRAIDLLGHMLPPPSLGCTVAGLRLCSPLGLGAVVDPSGSAAGAFERFGFGFLELGPLGEGDGAPGSATVDLAGRALRGTGAPVPLARLLRHLSEHPPRTGALRIVRLAAAGETAGRLAAAVCTGADAFILAAAASGPADAATVAAVRAAGRPCGVALPLGVPAVVPAGADFLVLDPATPVWSPAQRGEGLAALRLLAAAHPGLPILYAAGGIESPGDARDLIDAGASLLALSHGFVFTGPGLPKRINAALEPRRPAPPGPRAPVPLLDTARCAWFWMSILGLAMGVGGLLAGAFASGEVLLPYDATATGITPHSIASHNPRLLGFMAHDRMTLAGTMVSLGLLYLGLAWGGGRRGQLWAREAVAFSSFAGFVTFFAFLGYGYFDQFHAFVAAVLVPVSIQVVVGAAAPAVQGAPDLDNDLPWRRGVLGQLLFVLEAAGLLLAGLVITFLGSGRVFVATDLAFLGMDRAMLASLHHNLVPLIAHDRATFGGMLIASGVALGATALWGFARGERWLWWTLALGGAPAYLATLGIHARIGYTDLFHLSPVFIGLALHLGGLALSRGFLARDGR